MWRHMKGVSNPAEVKTHEKVQTKRKYDQEYDKNKRSRRFQASWQADYPWLDFDGDVMFCKLCREHTDLSDPASPYVQPGTSNFILKSVRDHNVSKSHLKVEARVKHSQSKRKFDDIDDDAAGRALGMLNTSVADRVKHLVRNAHAIAKNARPFTDYTWMCQLDKSKGLDIGNTYLTDKACKTFQESVAEVERQLAADRINNAKFLSVMVDGTTDSSVSEQELIYVRTVKDGVPSVDFISIEHVEKPDAPSILNALENAMDNNVGGEWRNKLVTLYANDDPPRNPMAPDPNANAWGLSRCVIQTRRMMTRKGLMTKEWEHFQIGTNLCNDDVSQ